MAKTPAEETELLRIVDVMREWKVSRDTIVRLMSRGELEWVRVGSRRMIARTSMRAYIERNAERAP